MSAQNPPKKVFIKSYGCQMNVYDSQRMADVMAKQGYAEVDSAEAADLIVLNTCHIREKAAEKVYSELGRMRRLKVEGAAAGREVMIGVAGCVAQAEGAEIVRRAPVVDLVLGPQNYHRLPDLLDAARRKPGVVDTDFPVEDKFDHLPEATPKALKNRGLTAFLTVQEGCDKFCSFCVVPYTRGSEISRPAAKIIAEAERLAASGIREITLLGQNVNAYHGEAPGGGTYALEDLLHRLAAIPGLARLRYTTSHPCDMSDGLIRAHADLPQLMPFLHLPVQSGSDRILDAMNRRHDRAFYLDIVRRVRAARPDIALSSDFIVGFPGESDADFAETLDLVEQVGFTQCYSFKYSSRPGTPGASLVDQVPEQVKDERLQILQALLNRQAKTFIDNLIGHSVDVLFEKPGRYPGQIAGRSPYLAPVQVMAPSSLIGTIARVRINQRSTYSLFGELMQ